ncbi:MULTISPECIES: sigma 54-interacting transcriptional regulator [Lutispora]|uniref:Sigma 54-interacting transcriptional regulator n=1 Tax=Lutispora saccharofermentans TaxID=3024236 RepID=A0ABT1ND87_9FIRM|nr:MULTISPECIES: sigma 54-interacting transcriptional regulator [Lutispora]MCQ1529230.1 sigma 54-interacting transcriptional regulator [Lutispora saccharofermentans]MEA4960894.1 sigma 54-interacting transcriptional regulator [Lutispora sp.]
MQNRILFISTYNELAELARKLSKELKIDMHIYEGGIMKDGHIYAKENEKNFDVIISQGGTAEAVKNIVDIPVVSVEIRFIDFLDAIYKAKQYGDRIGLVTYMSEDIKDLERIKTILDIDFKVFPYRTKEELKKQVDDATALGKLTLVGMGDCIMETAKVRNLNAVVIQTGEKQVKEAVIAAKNICSLGLREKEKAERFKTILDHSGDGIIALDRNGVIIIFNPAAEKIFELSADQVLDRSINNNMNRKYLGQIYGDGSHQLNKLVRVNNKQIVLNRLPIIIGKERRGMVMTFQEISKLQKLEQKVRTELYRKGLVSKYSFDDIIGESQIIKNTISQAKKIGKTSTTILIAGETGTGKELFAQSIHSISPRKDGPFVAINCAALPENLLESELFGYEEGAFTGAKKGGKIGLFELAHGGTIFLDEVGEMPLSLQGRLLRVLQEREVLRVGGDYILNVDIRVIAATNLNLYERVKEGKFREDLYFRLNILDLRLPALRERKEDIPLLLRNFIREMNAKHDTKIKDIEESGMELLKEYNWPGNIRQLENFTEKMCILSNAPIINESLIEQLLGNGLYQKKAPKAEKEKQGDTITLDIGNLKDIELQIIKEASKVFKGDKILLAEKLGMSRTTLWKRLKEIEDMEQ